MPVSLFESDLAVKGHDDPPHLLIGQSYVAVRSPTVARIRRFFHVAIKTGIQYLGVNDSFGHFNFSGFLTFNIPCSYYVSIMHFVILMWRYFQFGFSFIVFFLENSTGYLTFAVKY